jgi:hypothetical protein
MASSPIRRRPSAVPVGDLAQLGQLPPLSPVGKVSMFAVVQMAAVGLRCGFGNDCGQPLASIALCSHGEGDLPLLKTFKGEILTPRITGIS